jgi:DNA polymerase-1
LRFAFDLETNGLPRQGLSEIHCLVLKDLQNGHVFRFNNEGSSRPISDGLTLLDGADLLVGHNIIGFDIPVIRSFYPWFLSDRAPEIIDTLILSQLFFPDVLQRDFRQRPIGMPPKLYGRHGLEAWGYRLGNYKGEFGKTTDWQEWSPDMEDYCAQDVEVTSELYSRFQSRIDKHPGPVTLEMECAKIMAIQETHGWPFDVKKAQELESTLRNESDALSDKMRSIFPYVAGKEFTPARNNQTQGYIKGASFTKLAEFNPTSRDHITFAFTTWRDWNPTEFTDKGKPQINEKVLTGIGTEESKDFARLLELQKALGQLSEGKNSWLKKVTPEGRIHHRCILATNTGRNAHSSPNLGQVSSDPRCRALFGPLPGHVQVGADASGLELRMLGHYLAYFDGGRFADIVVNGDIHQTNADLVGVTRQQVKTIIYAFIYGAGDEKLGISTDPSLKGKEAEKRGKEIRSLFLGKIPGLKDLIDAVGKKAKDDSLKGLDGRPIKLQGKAHAALNYLLQGAGAIVCKTWVVDTHHHLRVRNFILDHDYLPLGFIHDEQVLSVRPACVDDIENVLESSISYVGEQLGLKVPLAAEAKHGANWSEVH